MKIPDGPSGHPTVSPTSLNVYGYSGFNLERDTSPRGCPAQYRAVYVDKVAKRPQTDPMIRGGVMHRALELMEDSDLGPDAALADVWDMRLTADDYTDLITDLVAYTERESSPLERYSTLGTEVRLDMVLCEVDGEEIHLQGIIDRIAFDWDTNTVHIGDWKYGGYFPSLDDVLSSVPMKAYALLVDANRDQLNIPAGATIVVHLDAIRYRELPGVRFSGEAMAAFRAWLVAAVKTIRHDDEAAPVVNEGCAYCPVRDSCPAFLAIPDLAAELLKVKPADADSLIAWRDRANAIRLVLAKAVADVDGRFNDDARRLGHVEAGGYSWDLTVDWRNTADLRRLHELLGDTLFDVATVTKTKLEQTAKMLPQTLADEVRACLYRIPSGSTVKKARI